MRFEISEETLAGPAESSGRILHRTNGCAKGCRRVGARGSKELNRGRCGAASDEQIIEFNCKTVGMI